MVGCTYTPNESEPVPCDPPAPIPWFPQIPELPIGWYFGVPKRFLKKAAGGDQFNKYLILQSDVGTITRQEAVSMLPPLFMDVQPHHYVLDLCAAPGSKTCQFIEALHVGGSALPTGLVIANDANRSRCDMLSHQLSRINSPNVAVTNHPGQRFPGLIGSKGESILFDRILCDVPCSGDGTFRKNPDLWVKWNPLMGVGNHNLQLSIAIRAFELLKPGGRMVYSTCAMNPVEDEAVVCTLLQKFRGQLQLVDVSKMLPGLKRRNGITSWRVMDKDLNWYSSHDELPEMLKQKIPSTCFPPDEQLLRDLNIERCLRLVPHDQDTGGFFVAVLDKAMVVNQNTKTQESVVVPMNIDEDQPIQTKIEIIQQQQHENQNTDPDNQIIFDEEEEPKGKKKNQKFQHKAPDSLEVLNQQTLNLCLNAKRFYGISDEFPFSDLVARSEELKPQKILLLAKGIREIIQYNPRLKVCFSGIRVFQGVQGEDSDYRLVQAGIHVVGPYCSSRLFTISADDLMILLSYEDPLFHTFSQEGQNKFSSFEVGSCIFVVQVLQEKMFFIGWRGKVSAKVLVKKTERNLLVQHFQGLGTKSADPNSSTQSAL